MSMMALIGWWWQLKRVEKYFLKKAADNLKSQLISNILSVEYVLFYYCLCLKSTGTKKKQMHFFAWLQTSGSMSEVSPLPQHGWKSSNKLLKSLSRRVKVYASSLYPHLVLLTLLSNVIFVYCLWNNVREIIRYKMHGYLLWVVNAPPSWHWPAAVLLFCV